MDSLDRRHEPWKCRLAGRFLVPVHNTSRPSLSKFRLRRNAIGTNRWIVSPDVCRPFAGVTKSKLESTVAESSFPRMGPSGWPPSAPVGPRNEEGIDIVFHSQPAPAI